jgi:ketosteroid isomerase-like protein
VSVPALLIAAMLAAGQTPPAVSPEDAVRQADDAFWAAYNDCDRARMADAFTEDAEFYHDITGLTRSRAAIVESLMRGPCGAQGRRLRREAIPNTVQAHALAGPYMLLTGDHLFYVQTPGEPERASAQARFTDIWRQEDGRWRMARVVSYDHRPPPYVPPPADPDFDPATLPGYAGRYVSDGFGDILIAAGPDHLRLTSGTLTLTLFPIAGGRFAARERDLRIAFSDQTLTVIEGEAVVATARRTP